MMKTLATALLLLSFTSSIAQNSKLDSLKRELKFLRSTQDSLDLYAEICRYSISYANPETGIRETEVFKTLAEKENDLEKISRANKYLSEYYMNLRNFENAEGFAKEAITISNKLNDLKVTLMDYNQLGRVYHDFGKDELAVKAYEKGISYYDGSHIGSINLLYSNLATSYWSLDDPPRIRTVN